MIVVIGCPLGRLTDGAVAATGMSSGVAMSASGAGRAVQLVGRVGDDPTADAVVLDLARGGVGHVALLRDPTRATPLEPPRPEESETDVDDDVGAAETADPPTVASAAPPGPALEAADVDLGLRYLTEFAVLVVAEPVDASTVAVVAEAARWGDARLIVVVPRNAPIPDGLPSDALVFEAPDTDPDGVFATLVGHFAAGLDEGAEPREAFRASLGSDGWGDAAADA